MYIYHSCQIIAETTLDQSITYTHMLPRCTRAELLPILETHADVWLFECTKGLTIRDQQIQQCSHVLSPVTALCSKLLVLSNSLSPSYRVEGIRHERLDKDMKKDERLKFVAFHAPL